MSARLARTLLKLYPRRVRDRYGEELLALEDELSAHGEGSRTRLIRDMLAGALLVRPTHHRSRLVIGAVCMVTAVAVATVIIGSRSIDVSAGGIHAAARPAALASLTQNRHAPTLTVPAQQGVTCAVAAGSSCSLTPCSEFVAHTSTQDPVARNSVSAVQRARSATTTRCAAYPHTHSQPPVFVGG
jgi:hypothetical protein